MSWHSLTVKNDWEYLTVTANGKRVEFQTVPVRWPDGHCEYAAIEGVTVRNTAHDHGNSYPVDSLVPALRINYHGHVSVVPLHTIKGLEVWTGTLPFDAADELEAIPV